MAGGRLCAFGVFALIAKTFGPTTLGALALAQSVAVYAVLGATLGLGLYAVKAAVERPTRVGSIATTVILARLVLGLGSFALLVLAGLVFPVLREIFPLLILFGLTVFTGAISLRWVAQAEEEPRVFGGADLVNQALYLFLVYLAWLAHLGPWSVAAAFVLAELLVALGVWVWMTRAVSPLEPPLPLPDAVRLVKEAVPIGGAQLLQALSVRADLIVLSFLMSVEAVGIYSAAYRFYVLGTAVTTLYNVVLFPHLSRQAGESVEAVRRELRKSLSLVFVVSVPLLLIGLHTAGDIVRWVFDPRFDDAELPLRILLVALVLSLASGHYRQALIAVGRQRQDLRNVTACSVAGLVAKVALIPLLGIAGAALGSIVAELLLITVGWLTLRSVREPTPSIPDPPPPRDLGP